MMQILGHFNLRKFLFLEVISLGLWILRNRISTAPIKSIPNCSPQILMALIVFLSRPVRLKLLCGWRHGEEVAALALHLCPQCICQSCQERLPVWYRSDCGITAAALGFYSLRCNTFLLFISANYVFWKVCH